MSDAYRPIACHVHDEFEIAIMRARTIEVELGEQGGWRRATILPLDTRTEDGAEYLVYREGDGPEQRVRLDRVRLPAAD